MPEKTALRLHRLSRFVLILTYEEAIEAGLQALRLEWIPSYGNFITFRVANALAVNQKLLKQGVIVRPLGGYEMPDHLRVTIGLEQENERFLLALKSAL